MTIATKKAASKVAPVKNQVKRLAVLTSGGDSSGMNACIRACVRYAMNQGYEVYGVKHGYVGLMKDEIYKMEYSSVSNSVHTGGTLLRTGRSPEFASIEGTGVGVGNLKKHGIDNLIVIGGDGSFHGVQRMHQYFDINVIGIPGTIDNDMGYTEYTLGFDTACNTVLDAIVKLRDTITSHDRIMVLEVMGRHCGDIALYTAVAGGAEFVICPEEPVDTDAIAEGVEQGFEKGKSSMLIVLAEGRNDIRDELMEKIRKTTNRTVNTVALSYVQRGGTPSMQDRVLATRFAVRAVDLLSHGQGGRCVGVKGNQIIDMAVTEALACSNNFDHQLYQIANIISR